MNAPFPFLTRPTIFEWLLDYPISISDQPHPRTSADTIEKRPASASMLRSMRCIDDEMAAAFDAAESDVADDADDDGADAGADDRVDADVDDDERRAEARRARIDETD